MKRVIAVLLLAILAFGFTGCGGAAVSSDLSSSSSVSSESSSEVSEVFDPAEHTLAICICSITHPVYRIVQLGFIASTETLGYKNILVSGLNEDNTAELIEKWDNDITENNVAGVAVWTGDDSNYDLLREWHDQGIKIVVPYFAHNYADANEFIDANPAKDQSDQYAMGAAAADFLVETLEENGINHGGLGVTTQNGSSVMPPYYSIGFRECIAELNTGFTLLDTAYEGPDATEAIKRVQDYIKNNPTIVGAFGTSGGCTSSWSAAKTNAGR